MYILNNFTVNTTDQNLQIFQLCKDHITREVNLKTNEIETAKPGNTYGDKKPSEEDYKQLSYSSQTPKKVTPNSQQNSDEGTASTQSKIALNTVEQENKNNENDNEEDKVNKDNDGDNKDQGDHAEDKDHEDTTKAKTSINMASITDVVQKLSREGDERKTITFLDFAGQSIYYAFHQIYLSGATFSILVVDMSKEFEDPCKPTNVSDDDFCCSRFESWTYKGNKYKRPFTCCSIRIYKSDFVEENLSNLCFFICRIL